ncbi:aspartoacylase [Aliagarivorans taiwanensis]|uniref:aspartoacylase n=1 Tax=Aliagarivorans taiwanensis TaxID=561966 RepID=UPI00041FBE7F|nr:aspartoacylase [Aliagarivorans taiwanensis]
MVADKINKVSIVGGTHGNEFTGIYLVEKWQQQPQLIARDGLTVETVFANPKAHGENKRYIDSDLNRQFASKDLADATLANYEQSRAKVLHQHLGPKDAPNSDFVIDLHNTTSNMGPCLLLVQQDPVYNLLAGYLKMKMPEAVIFRDEDHLAKDQHHLLASCGRFGVIVEVGPQSQSVIRQDVFEQMETMTGHILDFIQLYSDDALPELPKQVEAYLYLESLTLPVDEQGRRTAMVHSRVQDHDFEAIHPGDPIFRSFNGEDISYQGEKVVYPAFINEAAYYDNNLAMSLMEKVTIKVYGD